MPTLEIISWIFVCSGFISAIAIYVDINMGRYQAMPIMNIAWPITGLYLGPIAIGFYFLYARTAAHSMPMDHKMDHKQHEEKERPITFKDVFLSCTHCGSGCVIGDIVAETLVYSFSIQFFGAFIWASFFMDYGFAFLFGLLFQYYNIIHKYKDNLKKGIWNTIKADFFSLTFFEIGLFGWMLVSYYLFGDALSPSSIVYWFMMQVGMILGFVTTYPVNYLLIKWKIKELSCH